MKLVLEGLSGREEVFIESDHTIPRKGERIYWEERRALDGLDPGMYVVRAVTWHLLPPGSTVTLTLEAD